MSFSLDFASISCDVVNPFDGLYWEMLDRKTGHEWHSFVRHLIDSQCVWMLVRTHSVRLPALSVVWLSMSQRMNLRMHYRSKSKITIDVIAISLHLFCFFVCIKHSLRTNKTLISESIASMITTNGQRYREEIQRMTENGNFKKRCRNEERLQS